jgi:Spy/CpxP family protein refolding chaperone
MELRDYNEWGCRQEEEQKELFMSLSLTDEQKDAVYKLFNASRNMTENWENERKLQAQLTKAPKHTSADGSASASTADCLKLYEHVHSTEERLQKLVETMVDVIAGEREKNEVAEREAVVSARENELVRREQSMWEEMRSQRALMQKIENAHSGGSMARTRLCNLRQVYV